MHDECLISKFSHLCGATQWTKLWLQVALVFISSLLSIATSMYDQISLSTDCSLLGM